MHPAIRATARTSAPSTGNTTTKIDLIALHGESLNAISMARWYAARHRHTEAARKLRQGLSALRRLQLLEGGAA